MRCDIKSLFVVLFESKVAQHPSFSIQVGYVREVYGVGKEQIIEGFDWSSMWCWSCADVLALLSGIVEGFSSWARNAGIVFQRENRGCFWTLLAIFLSLENIRS